MRLESLDGSSVDLTVTGYEFPGSTGDSDDANWLMIRGGVSVRGRSWDFHQPCMTTAEALRLAGWLRGLCNTESADPELGFIEPNLRFELTEQNPERVTLAVRFGQESRPEPGVATGRGDRVTLTIPRSDLFAAVRSWERALHEFPQR